MFFRAGLTAFLPLDNERGEFIAIDFREHHINVGEATVGDEHFLAVENVVRAVGAQFRSRFCGQRI